MNVERNHVGSEEETSSLLLTQTTKVFPSLKVLQFFLVTWFVTAGLLPQHPAVEYMVLNQGPLLSSIIVMLSGLITHLRYRDFVIQGVSTFYRISNPRLLEYVYCRILRFAPSVILAIVYTLLLSVRYGDAWPLKVVASATLSSSLLNGYPWLPFSVSPDQLLPRACPALVYASLLLICWTAYPALARSLNRFINIFSPKRACLVSGMLFAAGSLGISIGMSLLLATLGRSPEANNISLIDSGPLRFGTNSWYVNPIIKLPAFLIGILSGEFVIRLGWADPRGDFNGWKIWTKWVLPYVGDALVSMATLACTFDPRVRATGPWLERWTLGGYYVLRLGGLRNSTFTASNWMVVGQYALLPLVSLSTALTCQPFFQRSLTSIFFCQEPITHVLDGRAGFLMSLFAYPIYYSLSEAWQRDISAGAGIFFFLFLLFTPVLLYYYYVYEPLNMWFTLRIRNLYVDSRQVGTNIPIPTSPHYDRFHLKDDSAESKVLNHLSTVSAPRNISQIGQWVYDVFVRVHYVV